MQTSAEAARVLRRIPESATTPCGETAAKFLVAVATERLRLTKADLATVLDGLPPHTSLVDELIALCQSRLLPA